MKTFIIALLVLAAVLTGAYYYFKPHNTENHIMVLNEQNFDEQTSDGLSIVDFYADWCGPCRMLSPIMEELHNELTDIKVFKVNVDESAELATRFDIASIPQVAFIKDGQLKEKLIGVHSKQDYLKKVEQYK